MKFKTMDRIAMGFGIVTLVGLLGLLVALLIHAVPILFDRLIVVFNWFAVDLPATLAGYYLSQKLAVVFGLIATVSFMAMMGIIMLMPMEDEEKEVEPETPS